VIAAFARPDGWALRSLRSGALLGGHRADEWLGPVVLAGGVVSGVAVPGLTPRLREALPALARGQAGTVVRAHARRAGVTRARAAALVAWADAAGVAL
jgi:hypothetical protein